MKLLMGLLAAMFLLAGVGTSHAVVRIANDPGGQIELCGNLGDDGMR